MLSTGKVQKAEKLIKKIAKINNEKVSETSISLLDKKECEKEEDEIKLDFSETFLEVFTNGFLFVRVIVMGVGWLVYKVYNISKLLTVINF